MDKQTWMIQGSKNQKIILRRFKNQESEKYKGIIHILHGMAEYGARYGSFAQFLVDQHYIVYVHDHRKHGKSLNNNERVGIFKNDTWEDMIEDVHHIQNFITSNEPNLPHIMLGHSMGSVVLRCYLTVYGEDVDQAIIMGTPYTSFWENKGAIAMSALCEGIVPSVRNKLLNFLFLGYMNKAFKPEKTPYDWLSKDRRVVEWYMNNPLCGYHYSPRFYKEFAKGLDYASREENVMKTPSIPILLISGEMDPVGKFMEGVNKVYVMYQRLGYDVEIQGIENGRHEILNETNRMDVYNAILQFIERNMDEKR